MRKGELAKSAIDSGWPHQVVIPASDAGWSLARDDGGGKCGKVPSLKLRANWFAKVDPLNG